MEGERVQNFSMEFLKILKPAGTKLLKNQEER